MDHLHAGAKLDRAGSLVFAAGCLGGERDKGWAEALSSGFQRVKSNFLDQRHGRDHLRFELSLYVSHVFRNLSKEFRPFGQLEKCANAQGFCPQWMQMLPNIRFLQPTSLNPAFSIDALSSSRLINRSVLFGR